MGQASSSEGRRYQEGNNDNRGDASFIQTLTMAGAMVVIFMHCF